MRLSKLAMGLLLIFCLACNNAVEKKTASGFTFQVLKEGEGEPGKPGQIMVYDFSLVDSKDSLWADTYSRGLPELAQVPDSAAQSGFEQMVQMLGKGDSVKFTLTVNEFFNTVVQNPAPPDVDTTRSLTYTMNVKEVLDRDAFMDYRTQLLEDFQKRQVSKDSVSIENYLEKEGIDAKRTESGIWYVITEEGEGPQATSGQTATVNYTGYLLDGTYFDTSIKEVAEEKNIYNPMREPYEPFEVKIDESGVIKGWHEALKLLSKGGKGTFYIPSTLGYGPQRVSEEIKENSVLVFEIEVVDLK